MSMGEELILSVADRCFNFNYLEVHFINTGMFTRTILYAINTHKITNLIVELIRSMFNK